MPEPEAERPAPFGSSLERSREEILAAAKPLPPYEEMVIEELTEEEERLFFDAIRNA